MILFFDFDGTIIENRARYHRVHAHCLGKTPAVLSETEYWELKRSRIPEKEILRRHYPNVDCARYQRERELVIESTEFLAFDTLLPGAHETLRTLKANHTLILVTLRKNSKTAMREIQSFGLHELCSDIRIAAAGKDPVAKKIELIRHDCDPSSWVIGDTEADILAGKALHLTTCGVLSGIRKKECLQMLNPTHLVTSIGELLSLLR